MTSIAGEEVNLFADLAACLCVGCCEVGEPFLSLDLTGGNPPTTSPRMAHYTATHALVGPAGIEYELNDHH